MNPIIFLPNHRLVAFDCETTGLSPHQGHKIVEIGAMALYGEELRPEEYFYSLVNPRRFIPAAVSNIHDITDEMVKNAPAFQEILPALLQFLDDSPLVIQNAPFDLSFLRWELRTLNLPKLKNRALDIIDLSKNLFPQEKYHNLDAICTRLGVEIFTPSCLAGKEEFCRHRALGDVILTAQAFIKMRKMLGY